jgi:multimeric flavodoxin WrbA
VPLTAIALNCTLKSAKPGAEPSSTDKLIGEVQAALGEHGVTAETVRVVDANLLPGVETDMGDGDGWPALRAKILAADILVFASPIWLGHLNSVAQRVLERMDAFFSDATDDGVLPPFGKVAIVATVGNEDGAHHVSAEVFQGLNDVGFTIPGSGHVYWVGEAMQRTDYKDLPETPEKVAAATRTMARNAVHLAGLLQAQAYPAE